MRLLLKNLKWFFGALVPIPQDKCCFSKNAALVLISQDWKIFEMGEIPKDATFCLQLEASCLHWSFLLTPDSFSYFTYNWSFFTYNFSFFTYNWSFFAYSGEVCRVSALGDCKQRSLTASKTAPTISKKASPILNSTGGTSIRKLLKKGRGL